VLFLKKIVLIIVTLLFMSSCATKQPIITSSYTILIKTPQMKFYDKGFISKYDNYIHLQIFQVGNLVLDLKIYKDTICQSTIKCISAKEFNEKYLHNSYKDDFLYNLFSQKKIYYKDTINNILIKVK
jgi:hypothetical protein